MKHAVEPFVTIVVILLVLQCAATDEGGQSCKTPTGRPGNCRNIKTCKFLMKILRNFGDKAHNFLRGTMCGIDDPDPLVCCPSINVDNHGHNVGNDHHDDENYAARKKKVPYPPLKPPVCGTHPSLYEPDPFIARDKLPPWMVIFGYRWDETDNRKELMTTGTLISRRHVLTEAHCVYTAPNMVVVQLGNCCTAVCVHDFSDVTVERAAIHPQFVMRTRVNNIAVLRLSREIEIGPNVRPICLPISDGLRVDNKFVKFPFDFDRLSNYYNGPMTREWLHLQVPDDKEELCRNAFKNETNMTMDEHEMCDPYYPLLTGRCYYGGGNPLVVTYGSTFYVIGIDSFGLRCGKRGHQSIYTKVTPHLGFILSAMT